MLTYKIARMDSGEHEQLAGERIKKQVMWCRANLKTTQESKTEQKKGKLSQCVFCTHSVGTRPALCPQKTAETSRVSTNSTQVGVIGFCEQYHSCKSKKIFVLMIRQVNSLRQKPYY